MSKRGNSFSAARWTTALSLVLLLAAAGHDVNKVVRGASEIATQGTTGSAADQIFNEGDASTTLRNSVVEAGVSAGTLDGGGNIDSNPLFVDPAGPDGRLGTVDDDYRLSEESLAIDGGRNDLVIVDRFDLDGDGDLAEWMPVDHSGAARVGGMAGAKIVDIGAYEYGAAGAVSSEPAPWQDGAGPELLSIYPIPAKDGFRIRLGAGAGAGVQVLLHDILGRRVRTIHEGVWPGGVRELHVETSQLASGVYTVVLLTDRNVQTQQAVVVR